MECSIPGTDKPALFSRSPLFFFFSQCVWGNILALSCWLVQSGEIGWVRVPGSEGVSE